MFLFKKEKSTCEWDRILMNKWKKKKKKKKKEKFIVENVAD